MNTITKDKFGQDKSIMLTIFTQMLRYIGKNN